MVESLESICASSCFTVCARFVLLLLAASLEFRRLACLRSPTSTPEAWYKALTTTATNVTFCTIIWAKARVFSSLDA